MRILVNQDTRLSRLWMVSCLRPNVSATVWQTDSTLGFHRTARAAREAAERTFGSIAWQRSTGRGCANYYGNAD